MKILHNKITNKINYKSISRKTQDKEKVQDKRFERNVLVKNNNVIKLFI